MKRYLSSSARLARTDYWHQQRDLILSVLNARPSARDSKSFLASFRKPQKSTNGDVNHSLPIRALNEIDPTTPLSTTTTAPEDEILDPINPRTGLVKLQGPFTDRQLDSIGFGMNHLRELGLVSVVVVDSELWSIERLKRAKNNGPVAVSQLMTDIREEVIRVTETLIEEGSEAIPILHPIAHLDSSPKCLPQWATSRQHQKARHAPETCHINLSDLVQIRKAIKKRITPVIPSFAINDDLKTIPVHADEILVALSESLVEAQSQKSEEAKKLTMDISPLRLLIITKTGGIPSPARSGLPHLSINLSSEHEHIASTFVWESSHPSALTNLSLARRCLMNMPQSSTALIVGHRSAMELVANLITNKPAHSASLPHELLVTSDKITTHTPTSVRLGAPIQCIRNFDDIDQDKLTHLLESSFKRVLDREAFYGRLKKSLDFVIIAGDYGGCAIVTNEVDPGNENAEPIAYLDKFAVLPSMQGDGTVDFLWLALRDESFGLGLLDALNTNGGLEGKGVGKDLVWRSRGNNPINKWYFERATGFLRVEGKTEAARKAGGWVMFWADAEDKLARKLKGRHATPLAPTGVSLPGSEGLSNPSLGLSLIEDEEQGRLLVYEKIAANIASSWK
ncbi:hypothetical protein E3Q23_03180 [Wallemia mellicola]|uniref:Amino-acid acetyltransferase, mitochondrial n=1 Tax=Wallemia mellicola TaxID=1708541 RepID=A0A4T0LT71_9BASI|nr:hypothetical protein E3Q23_03180 [Wallemia mellicola]TIC09812.1 hypothetical protein E3Q15_03330 [Wallemia mellicola]TIC63651.1 hypothetical protein E3Q01_03251 [Wallemia mellicola]